MIFGSKIEGLLSAIAIAVASGAIGSILTPTEFRMPGIHFQIGDIGVDAPPGSDGLQQCPAPPQNPNPMQMPQCPTPEFPVRIPPPPALDVLAFTSHDPVATLSPLPSPITPPIAPANTPNTDSNLVANANAPGDGPTNSPTKSITQNGRSTTSATGGSGPSRAGIVGARPTASIFPVYPETSRLRGEEGTVELSFIVLATGKTADISLARSSGFPPLDEAAIRAVRRARFTPATRNGSPVQSKMLQPFEFRLR